MMSKCNNATLPGRVQVQVLHNMDTLLYIFKHLSLRDCFTCRLVSPSWLQAVDKHFRTLSRLNISFKDVSQISEESQHRSSREVSSSQLHTLEVHQIQNYHKFAYTLSMFPSVQHFTLANHPLNDIFLSLLVVFLPRLSRLKLQSCWMHPTMLQQRLSRSQHSVNPLWTILNRIYCPKYLQEHDSSLEYLLDTIRQFCSNESLCIQLCSYLQGVTLQSSLQHSQLDSSEVSLSLCAQSQLSKTGYRLLVQSYSKMTYLTLSNCGLTEETAQMVLQELREIKHLNIVDNESIEGHCLQYLSPTCESLIAGSFNLQVSILDLLGGIVHSKASRLRHLELTGFISASLHHLEQLFRLECLVLHFYCDRVGPQFVPFYSIARLPNLRTLVLQQEYCYEEKSALEHDLLCVITQHCNQLERLEVLGEYGWKLQLNDQSLLDLASNATNLRHLALTGNSMHITDKGIESLGRLTRLKTLTLTSFEGITDRSISEIVLRLRQLSKLCLRDNSQLTIKTLETCVQAAYANPDRTLNVHIDEKQMSASKLLMKYASSYILDTWHHKIDPLLSERDEPINEQTGKSRVQGRESFRNDQDRKRLPRWPANLKVVVDENLRSYKYDGEDLTLLKLVTIFCASVLIILMMVTTLAVVVFLPAGMALYLLYEKIFTNVLLLRANQ